MVKRIAGKIRTEMNREHLATKGPKTKTGASLRGMRTISPARQGRYWRDDEDF